MKKGDGQQADEITKSVEQRLWTAGRGDDREKKAMDSRQRR